MCLTNSVIPPSYLWTNFVFFVVASNNVMQIPLFKKASSLILFSRILELNFIEEKISLDGKNVILVPFFFVLPIFFKGFKDFPSPNFISYSFPSL